MAWYNLTAVNATGILPLAQSVSNLFLFEQLGNLILIMLFFITFLAFYMHDQSGLPDMMYSSFIIGIISFMFRYVNLVPDITVVIAWAMLAFSIFLVVINR